MPFIIPETMPADWIVDFAVDDTTGDIADAMRVAYDSTLKRQGLDNLMGRLKAACLAAAENARSKTLDSADFGMVVARGVPIAPNGLPDSDDAPSEWVAGIDDDGTQDWPDNAADHT